MADKTVTVAESGGDYASLNSALSTEAANLTSASYYGGGPGRLIVSCSSFSDTTAAGTGTGYTTDSSYYIYVQGNYAVTSGAHYSESYYRLEVATTVFQNQEDYTVIEGVQVKLTASSGSSLHGLYTNQKSVSFKRCVVYQNFSSGASGAGVMLYGAAGKNMYVENCVVYGNGISSCYNIRQIIAGTAYINNCTSEGNNAGITCSAGTMYVTNCAVFNNTDDLGGTTNPTYTATDDGDAGTGNVTLGGSTQWAANFSDYAAHNFHLINGAPLIGAGSDISGTYGYTNDLDGDTRSGSWDIGADEYVSAATGNPWSYYAQAA